MSTATATRPQPRTTRTSDRAARTTTCTAPTRTAPAAPRVRTAQARPAASPAPRPAELRAPGRRTHLTGRGRALVLLALVALLLAAFAFGRSASHAAVTADVHPTLTQVTVQQGDTLWSVARRLAPHRDPREVVTQLQELNHLPSSALRAGQQLLLPVAV